MNKMAGQQEHNKELECFTIDNVRAGADLNVYHSWLERQRVQDKKNLKNQLMKVYSFKNRERIKESRQKYYVTHKEIIAERRKKFYAKNRERYRGRYLVKGKLWRQKNKSRINEYHKKYYAKHRELILRKKHDKYFDSKKNEYQQKKRRNDKK